MAKIINFHEIRDPKWFEETLITLKKMYPVGTLQDVENFYNGEQKNFFHITVDDGDLSNYHTIYPCLKKLGLTATIFVSPYIAKTGKNFWFQEIEGYNDDFLRQIIADKFSIDKKLLEQFYVGSILKNMRLNDIEEIISIYQKKHNVEPKPRRNMNVSELSDILNTEITHFAYPNGDSRIDFGQREIEILKNTSIKYAYSFDFKKLRMSDDRYSIPRFGNPSYIKRKMMYSEVWENIKRYLGLHSETKHRNDIKKQVSFLK